MVPKRYYRSVVEAEERDTMRERETERERERERRGGGRERSNVCERERKKVWRHFGFTDDRIVRLWGA